MSEHQPIMAEHEIDLEVKLQPLERTFRPLAAPSAAPHNLGFQLPRSVWAAMLSCYAVFFVTIFAATGGSVSARFAIVICVLYNAIYFGVARIGARQAGREAKSPLEQGKMLDTWTGPMGKTAVYSQILIVPFAVALFGCAILIITVFVGIGE